MNVATQCVIAAVAILFAAAASPHGNGVSGTHLFDWHNETVARVVSPGFSWNNLGGTVIATPGNSVNVEDRTCMRAVALDVDVRDSFGFDLNEPVVLRLVVDRQSSAAAIAVLYDRVGGPGRVERQLDAKDPSRFVTLSVPLPAARFANRGDHATDLMLVASSTVDGSPTDIPELITVCDLAIDRSFETLGETYGGIELSFTDATGGPTAVRVGLYDEIGRLPIPAPDAVAIRKFDDLTRTYLLKKSALWPHDNRFVFYIDGSYRAQVPNGRYRLIATKGIEYRVIDDSFDVNGAGTVRRTYRLERYADMPARGWYSGDVHIHSLRRDAQDSRALLAQVRGEDVHVANILQMGNVAATYFPQPAWGKAGRYAQGVYTLVPGQEDPRTLTLGHTIHLDLEQPVRFADDYLNYQRVFEAVAAQGGVSGFAHAAGSLPGTVEGMTMQATLGLLDFGEVMQDDQIVPEPWFALLNLGFRFAPAAGTDYPYIDHPGAVRTYVATRADATPDAWFAGLEAGRSFVTNGPLLELTANSQPVGSEIRLNRGDALKFRGEASMNPDIGKLTGLELIRHGRVIASEHDVDGAEKLTLTYAGSVEDSAWYVLRAYGQRAGHSTAITAITAPIYVVVDGQQRTWDRAAVPAIATQLIGRLERIKNRVPADVIESESWDSMPVWAKDFPRQLDLVRPNIEAVQQKLRELERAAQGY